MNTFINLSAQKSKGIDYSIYKNARQLRKDALLIAEKNKSFCICYFFTYFKFKNTDFDCTFCQFMNKGS